MKVNNFSELFESCCLVKSMLDNDNFFPTLAAHEVHGTCRDLAVSLKDAVYIISILLVPITFNANFYGKLGNLL